MAEAQVMRMMTCLAALTSLRKVESPSLYPVCDPATEFPHAGICCKNCPAGTFVEEFCTFPQTLGICKPCIDGETYTDRDNGLLQCFSCNDCKPGDKMIAPCTRKKNTECQCNDGYFRPQGFEECVKCRTQCPKGQVTIERCNATTDMKCGPPHSDSSFASICIWTSVAVVVFLVVLGILAYFIYKRRKSSSVMNKVKEESTDHLIPDNENIKSATEATAPPQDRVPETAERENVEMGRREQVLPNRPSVSSSLEAPCSNGQSRGRNDVRSSSKPGVKFNTSCMQTLEKAYFQTKDIMVSNYWERLMRICGLSYNDLQSIKHDNAQHLDEQHYQMLRTLRDRNGVVAAFNKIFAGLKEMQLNGIYENLINELKSKDLIIKETED